MENVLKVDFQRFVVARSLLSQGLSGTSLSDDFNFF
jgi:hypothetical protein